MIKHTKTEIQLMHEEIASKLSSLSKIFTGDYKLTFVARHPTDPERSTMVSDDGDTDALINHILCLATKEEISL